MKTIRHALLVTFALFFLLSLAGRLEAQNLPADTVGISPDYALLLTVGRLYRISTWPNDPPLPPAVLGTVYGMTEDGLSLLVNSETATNYAVYYSASAQAIFLDDRLVAAEEMLAEAAVGRKPIMSEEEQGGGGYTEGLWLEPISIGTNLFNVVLHGATNGAYYLITSTEYLDPVTNSTWQIEGWVQGGDTDPTPFTLGIAYHTNTLFIRAQACDDCATVTLPLAWQLSYFGVTGVDTNADYDNDGVNNLAEYLNGTDPNKIIFAPHFAHYSVNSTTAYGSFDIYAGVPSQMAILVNSNSFAAAQWQAYTPDFSVALGPTDGVYNVWIGLRGLSADSKPTWNWVGLTRDLEAPSILISSPAGNVTAQPMIDLRGYSPERLLRLSYDVANDAGTIANLQGLITDQYLDPSSFKFTTNWFLCPDIELTNGANTITLRATDMAGNTSTNVYTYTLDFSVGTNAPLLALYWPQDGEVVCGSPFTIRGELDDPTAGVVARITDPNGNMTTVKGLVERNGLVWIENLPLVAGTNSVALAMTNAAGYWSMTNFTVIQSDDVGLTINEVPQEQLASGLATVTGTIDSPDFTVWVNGVMMTNMTDNLDGTWSWEVDYVQINSGGTAVIQAVAIPNSVSQGRGTGRESRIENAVPGNPSAPDRRSKEADPEINAFKRVSAYHATFDHTWDFAADAGGGIACHYWWAKDWRDRWSITTNPVPATGLLLGTYNEGEVSTNTYVGADPEWGAWDWAEWDTLYPDLRGLQGCRITTVSPGGPNSTNGVTASLWSMNRIWKEHTPYFAGWSYVEGFGGGYTTGRVDRVELIQVKLLTGGKRLPKWKNFYRLWGAATNYPAADRSGTWIPQTVVPEAIFVMGKALIGLDGPTLWGTNYVALPDNEEHDITPIVDAPRYEFTINAQQHKLTLQHHCPVGGDTKRTDLGVGEEVTLSFAPDLVTNSYWYNTWSTTAGSVAPLVAISTRFTAPSNASPATVTATLGDVQVDVPFAVFEPTGFHHANIESTTGQFIPSGVPGAWMRLGVYIAPSNVSFYRVEILEGEADASGKQGYFLDHGAPSHNVGNGANVWHPVVCDNRVTHAAFDTASLWGNPALSWRPLYDGRFTWNIPTQWRIPGGQTNPMTGWSQVFILTNASTMRIEKFNTNVTRTINNYITPLL